MKKVIALAVVIFCVTNLYAQTNDIDSLKQLLRTETKDTSRVMLLTNLAFGYLNSKPDTSLLLSEQALSLSKKAGFTKGEAASLKSIGHVFLTTGNYPKALEAFLQALRKSEAIQNEAGIAEATGNIANVYSNQGDYRKGINYIFKSLSISKRLGIQRRIAVALISLGDTYEKLNMLDSAKYYTDQGYHLAVR